MNLRSLSDQELLRSTKRAVEREREAITEVLHHFSEIDKRKLFGECSSLYEYAIKEHGYSEAEANARVTASRLLRQVPEIEEKIESGSLTLTHLVKASSFFAQEKKATKPLAPTEKLEVLEILAGKSVREGQRLLLSLSSNPMPLKERTRQASATHTEITFFASDETMAKLKRVKEIWAHALPAPTWEELIARMADLVIEKNDPLKKAERAFARKEKRATQKDSGKHQHSDPGQIARSAAAIDQKVEAAKTPEVCCNASLSNSVKQSTEVRKPAERHSLLQSMNRPSQSRVPSSVLLPVLFSGQKARPGHRRKVPASVEHEVRVRDGDRCTFVNAEGRRCLSRHGLELDHIIPHALGGASAGDNLRLRCRAHNVRAAIEVYGEYKMTKFICRSTVMALSRTSGGASLGECR